MKNIDEFVRYLDSFNEVQKVEPKERNNNMNFFERVFWFFCLAVVFFVFSTFITILSTDIVYKLILAFGN